MWLYLVVLLCWWSVYLGFGSMIVVGSGDSVCYVNRFGWVWIWCFFVVFVWIVCVCLCLVVLVIVGICFVVWWCGCLLGNVWLLVGVVVLFVCGIGGVCDVDGVCSCWFLDMWWLCYWVVVVCCWWIGILVVWCVLWSGCYLVSWCGNLVLVFLRSYWLLLFSYCDWRFLVRVLVVCRIVVWCILYFWLGVVVVCWLVWLGVVWWWLVWCSWVGCVWLVLLLVWLVVCVLVVYLVYLYLVCVVGGWVIWWFVGWGWLVMDIGWSRMVFWCLLCYWVGWLCVVLVVVFLLYCGLVVGVCCGYVGLCVGRGVWFVLVVGGSCWVLYRFLLFVGCGVVFVWYVGLVVCWDRIGDYVGWWRLDWLYLGGVVFLVFGLLVFVVVVWWVWMGCCVVNVLVLIVVVWFWSLFLVVELLVWYFLVGDRLWLLCWGWVCVVMLFVVVKVGGCWLEGDCCGWFWLVCWRVVGSVEGLLWFGYLYLLNILLFGVVFMMMVSLLCCCWLGLIGVWLIFFKCMVGWLCVFFG